MWSGLCGSKLDAKFLGGLREALKGGTTWLRRKPAPQWVIAVTRSGLGSEDPQEEALSPTEPGLVCIDDCAPT